MEKVKVTKEQSNSIEYAITKHSLPSIIRIHVEDGKRWCNECSGLNGMDLDTLIRALYIGYEVELTPEDKVKEYYFNQIYNTGSPEHNIPCAIREVLRLLNIKIEGVNT